MRRKTGSGEERQGIASSGVYQARQCWPVANNVNHDVERACRTQPLETRERVASDERKPRIFPGCQAARRSPLVLSFCLTDCPPFSSTLPRIKHAPEYRHHRRWFIHRSDSSARFRITSTRKSRVPPSREIFRDQRRAVCIFHSARYLSFFSFFPRLFSPVTRPRHASRLTFNTNARTAEFFRKGSRMVLLEDFLQQGCNRSRNTRVFDARVIRNLNTCRWSEE